MPSPAAVVADYLASFAGGDPDRIVGFVADGFRNEHLSALGTGSVGRDEYRRRLPDFLAAFTERRYSVDATVEQPGADDTDVVVRYRFTAVYDGFRIEIPGVMWFGVRDGLLVSRIDSWDSLTFLRQTDQV